MRAGTIQRTRDAALRLADFVRPTRVLRQRLLSTENESAARRPGATREYQSDSSSKRPALSVAADSQGG
jgi:hypothetical protein